MHFEHTCFDGHTAVLLICILPVEAIMTMLGYTGVTYVVSDLRRCFFGFLIKAKRRRGVARARDTLGR